MAAQSFDRLDGVIWFDGELVPWKDAKVHVLTHGLHYASCVFEGERAYGGEIFKSHRALRAAEAIGRDPRLRNPLFGRRDRRGQATWSSRRTAGSDAYVRPVAWRGSEMMGVSAQNNKIHLAIATWEWPSYFDPEQRLKGIRLDLADYRRPDPQCAPVMAKAAGLYMICTISKHEAERKGYADAMMLDWQGRVAECTGANIFFVKDGEIHTPIADCFLDGITRQTVIELAKKRGIEVIERRIMPEELSTFSECFITGTAAEVTAVSEIAGMEFQSRRHHQAADGRLHRGGDRRRQGRGGVILLHLSGGARSTREARRVRGYSFSRRRLPPQPNPLPKGRGSPAEFAAMLLIPSRSHHNPRLLCAQERHVVHVVHAHETIHAFVEHAAAAARRMAQQKFAVVVEGDEADMEEVEIRPFGDEADDVAGAQQRDAVHEHGARNDLHGKRAPTQRLVPIDRFFDFDRAVDGNVAADLVLDIVLAPFEKIMIALVPVHDAVAVADGAQARPRSRRDRARWPRPAPSRRR